MNQPETKPKMEFSENVTRRHLSGKVWRALFLFSTFFGILALATLLLNVINQSSGYVIYKAKVDPATLAVDGVPLESQTK